jgi:phosphomethylpyrimidine synthase
MALEVEKAKLAVRHGAELICDQSVAGELPKGRKELLSAVDIPIGSIPLYQNVEDARRRSSDALAFSSDDVVRVFEEEVRDGVTQPGIHGMTSELAVRVEMSKRIIPIVSRGGNLMFHWMRRHGQQNPYFAEFHRIVSIARNHDIPITLVAAMRSGTVVDGFDEYQALEWSLLRQYIEYAHQCDVGVIIDGLGHLPINEIPQAVQRTKEATHHVPLGVLGPAVTDRGLGHEHVAHAIGTAVAVWNGANYCNACYRTEHLGLPEIEDIADGIGASVIATHAGDLGRRERSTKLFSAERDMSSARKMNRWGQQLSLALDQQSARETFQRVGGGNLDGEGCNVCGDLCPHVLGSAKCRYEGDDAGGGPD